MLVSALKQYNPWGDLREEFEPTFDNTLDFGLPPVAGQPSRRFFYDGRGRAIRTINSQRSSLDVCHARVGVGPCQLQRATA